MNSLDGFYIVVLDKGFVYVGDCQFGERYLTISDAQNIRVWGTKHGLGELRSGPTKTTLLDSSGTVIAPLSRVIHLLKASWPKK